MGHGRMANDPTCTRYGAAEDNIRHYIVDFLVLTICQDANTSPSGFADHADRTKERLKKVGVNQFNAFFCPVSVVWMF